MGIIMKKIALAGICGTLLVACSTYEAPAEVAVNNQMVVNKSFDDVWSRATEYFANNNIPIKNVAKDSGLITTEYRLSANSNYLDCGDGGIFSKIDDKLLNLNTVVKRADTGGTDIRINVFGSGRATPTSLTGSVSGSSQTVDCRSTGQLEGEILAYVSQ